MAKKKNKYAADREMQSEVFKNGLVSTYVYKSNPKLELTVIANLSDDVICDLKNAVDEILKYHGH